MPHPTPAYVELQAQNLVDRLNLGAQPGASPATSNELLPLYNASIEQAHSARNAFTQDARNALATMFVTFTAGGALLLAWLSASNPRHWTTTVVIGGVAIVMFILPMAFRDLWMRQVRTSYQTYLGASIHMAVVARSLDLPLVHPWRIAAEHTEWAPGQLERRRATQPQDGWKELDASSDDDMPGDEIRFVKSKGVRKAALNNEARITAVWEASEDSFYSTYRSMLQRVIPRIGIIFAVCTLLLVLVSLRWPAQFWPQANQPVIVPEAVPVKVTRAMQPVALGATVRVTFGDRYPLDRYGETQLPGASRGQHYEIIDSRGKVLAVGTVPDKGILFERLD